MTPEQMYDLLKERGGLAGRLVLNATYAACLSEGRSSEYAEDAACCAAFNKMVQLAEIEPETHDQGAWDQMVRMVGSWLEGELVR